MAQKSTKGNNCQLDLLEEKRAYVVITLTDRLALEGKLAAFNCLAHYNSKVGYSWASIPTAAKESGLSPSSTKTIKRGLDQIVKVGAFTVLKGTPRKGSKKSSTHHHCPIMQWFRDEYARLQKAGRLEQDNDEFEDIREQNRSGSQPDHDQDRSGSQPEEIGFTAGGDRVLNPVRSGSQPEEENRVKRTDLNELKETKNASGGGPAVSSKLKAANDDNKSSWPDDAFKQFWDFYPHKINRKNAKAEFDKIKSAGLVDWKDIMRGVRLYKSAKPDHQSWLSPVTYLRDERWTDQPGKPPVKQNERRPAI